MGFTGNHNFYLVFDFYIFMYYMNSSALWSSLTGVNIEMNPCRIRADDAMLFFGLTAREAITNPLNLTDVR